MPEGAKKRKSPEAIGRDFARSVSWEMTRAATVSQKEIEQNLRNLEKYYVNQLEEDPASALEIRRRVSERLLEQAIFRRNSLSKCRARFSAASRLGFTNLERKAHCCMLYAQYAFARGNKRVANKAAATIVVDLEESLKGRKSLLGKQCLRHAKRFLESINSAEKPMDGVSNHV